MHCRLDDEIYRVDSVWLGPRKYTLPWRARYVAYGLGLFVFVVLNLIERRVGIPLSFWAVMWTLLGTVVITSWILRLIDYERPLGTILKAVGSEIGAPRPEKPKAVRIRCRIGRFDAPASPAKAKRRSGRTA